MQRIGELWMGKLAPYMDENFIRNSFKQMGEDISGVKMRKTKFGEPASYCFVHFVDELSALLAMHRLHGKLMPGSLPPVNFHLNHSSLGGNNAVEKIYSIFVGNLSPNVDDCTLFKCFYERYHSVRHAFVIRYKNGRGKGYGFVHFILEEDQKKALIEMQGFKGIGSNGLIVEMEHSHPKPMAAGQATWSGQPQASTSATTTQQHHNQYNDQRGNNYASSAQRPNYGNYSNTAYPTHDYGPEQPTSQHPATMPAVNQGDALTAPMGMPIAILSQQKGQQWPINGNCYNPAYDHGPQQPLLGQPPLMPAGFQGVAFRPPMGMQTAHSSGHVVQQQQYNLWRSPMTPAANIPPRLQTPPIGMQMPHSSQYVGQQRPDPWQCEAYRAATCHTSGNNGYTDAPATEDRTSRSAARRQSSSEEKKINEEVDNSFWL